MPQSFVQVRGIDPLLFRDGRPFTNAEGGLTAVSLPLPRPTTLAGFIRTQVGNAQGWDWTQEESARRAHRITVHGPLLKRDDTLLFPPPLDALLKPDGTPVRLLPDLSDAGPYCDLPEGLKPLVPAESFSDKPPRGYHYWTQQQMLDWLQNKPVETLTEIAGLSLDERVGIDVKDRMALEGMLYTVQLRCFEEKNSLYSLIARVHKEDKLSFNSVGSFGGERRLATVAECPDSPEHWTRCPCSLKTAITQSKRIRLTLATPALFSEGWKPGWITDSGRQNPHGHLPGGIANVKLKLVAAAVGRREPLSGWSIRLIGHRSIRWMAPAGSTYFFEAEGDTSLLWDKCWLQPVSDEPKDRDDGLGLALWGVW
jgi:CRISPR-associated protein Cmr3